MLQWEYSQFLDQFRLYHLLLPHLFDLVIGFISEGEINMKGISKTDAPRIKGSSRSVTYQKGQTLVAIYTRVSTSKQELTRQNEELKKFLASNTVVDETTGEEIPKYVVWNGIGYQDQAKSGRTFQREDLQRMLTDAKMNKFEMVITWGLSRLGRNLKETVNYLDDLWEAGVDYYDCQMNLQYSNDMQRTLMYNMASFHDHQWREMKRNTQDRMTQIGDDLKAAGCRLGNPSILDDWVESPRKVREDKQGLAVKYSPEKEQLFRDLWEKGVPVKVMCSHFRTPVNPKCGHNKSPNMRKMYCGGKPPQDHELAKQASLKCYCGRPCSTKTITVTRIKLGLEKRNPHSFVSKSNPRKDESLMVNFNEEVVEKEEVHS